MWSYNDDVKDDPYDPEAAKKLLAEAGFPNGFETDLWAMPVQRPYNPNAKRMAEIIQSDLDKVGVKAKVVTYEWAEYLKRARAGEQQTILLGCDASKTSSSRWCFKPYDDLMQQARKIADVNKRTELYKQAQVIFKDEAP